MDKIFTLVFGLAFPSDTLYLAADSVLALWTANSESAVVGYRVYVDGAGESASYMASSPRLRIRNLRVGLHQVAVSAYTLEAESAKCAPVYVRRLAVFLHPGDINEDGVFNVADSLAFRKSFKKYSSSKWYRVRADYDRSGYVSEYDRGYFEALWQTK